MGLSPLLAGAPYRASAPGKRVTSVNVDVPRHLPGRPAHAASAAGSGKKPTPVSHGSTPNPAPQSKGPGWMWADSQDCARAEAMWGARGFQGTSGQAPCVLTTVTSRAHSETQHKAPPRQRSCLINMLHHAARLPSKPKGRGWDRGPGRALTSYCQLGDELLHRGD